MILMVRSLHCFAPQIAGKKQPQQITDEKETASGKMVSEHRVDDDRGNVHLPRPRRVTTRSQQLVTVGVVIATRFEPVKWFMMDNLTSCVANPLEWLTSWAG